MNTSLIDRDRDTGDAGVEELPVEALAALLDDLTAMLLRMDADIYTARPVSGTSGSIGGHVRHLLDHVGAFLEAGVLGFSYDDRQRGTAVESSPAAALTRICTLQGGLERIRHRSPDEHVRVQLQMSRAGKTMTSWSTLGRELAFVVSHTIHHQAIIAILLAPRDRAVLPERFGYAPSTPSPG